jgi:hypothetical protein
MCFLPSVLIALFVVPTSGFYERTVLYQARTVSQDDRCRVISWESDVKPLDFGTAADRIHIRDDVARIQLIALRWARSQPQRRALDRPELVKRCTADLIAAIAKGHRVTIAQVKSLREDGPW